MGLSFPREANQVQQKQENEFSDSPLSAQSGDWSFSKKRTDQHPWLNAYLTTGTKHSERTGRTEEVWIKTKWMLDLITKVGFGYLKVR